MLFDKLDIEEQLDSGWAENKLFCSARHTVVDVTDAPAGTAAKLAREDAAVEAAGAQTSWTKARQEARVKTAETEQLRNTDVSEEQEEIIRKSRWQDQCFLIEGWRPLATKFKTCGGGTSGYNNVIPVSVEPSDIVSILGKRANTELFLNLTTSQMSDLQPVIRLFIVNYKQAGGKVTEHGEPIELFLDIDTPRECEDDKSTQRLPDSTGDSLLSRTNQCAMVGLRRFSYEFDGKDPATTDSLIKCGLELFLTNFDALTRVQKNGGKFLDLLLRTQKMIPPARRDKLVKDKDNFFNACNKKLSKKETDSELVFNPLYRRIKIQVGWAVPRARSFYDAFRTNKTIPSEVTNDPLFESKIASLFEDMTLNLFLEMTKYNFTFGQDGRLTLKIDYRGAIEGEMNEPESNIFFRLVAKQKKLLAAKKKQLRHRAAQTKDKTKKGTEGLKGDDLTEKQKEIAQNETAATSTIEKHTQLQIDSHKLDAYSLFLDKLQETGKIIALRIKKDALNSWKGDTSEATTAGKDNVELAKIRKQTGAIAGGDLIRNIINGGTEYGSYEILSSGEGTRTAAQQKKLKKETGSVGKTTKALAVNASNTRGQTTQTTQVDPKTGATTKTTIVKPDQDPKKESREKRVRAAALSSSSGDEQSNTKNIYFTFLGDILDTAMWFVSVYNRENASAIASSLRLMTSQVNFEDPMASYVGEDRRAILNIADIPVSLDEFTLWFYNNIIKEGRTVYYILDFIKDVMTNLVFQAFGYNCNAGAPAPVPLLNYTLFSLPQKDEGGDPLPMGRTLGVKDLHNITTGVNIVRDPTKMVNYFIISGTSRSFVNRKAGDFEQDATDGIYHFQIGRPTGVLRRLDFKGSTLKYATETRVIEDGQSGIDQLFEKFDGSVNLIGCSFFRNGQYIFLDPVTMGVSSEVARSLGMGGYYNIYNVTGEITPGKGAETYVTQLQCKYQGSGLCGDQTIDKSSDICSAAGKALTKKLRKESKERVVKQTTDSQMAEQRKKDERKRAIDQSADKAKNIKGSGRMR